MKVKVSEAEVLRSVRSLLKARGIVHMRMNCGAMKNAAGQHVQFGAPGMADLIAWPVTYWNAEMESCTLWIECKSSTGKQSKQQKWFEGIVEPLGHTYLLVRSAEEVEEWLSDNLP